MRIALTLFVLTTLTAHSLGQSFAPKELKHLASLLGTFEGTLKGPMGDVKVTLKNEWAEGGMWLRSSSIKEIGAMKITETCLIGYDTRSKSFKSWSFQSMVSNPREEEGAYSESGLIMVSKPWEMAGGTYTSRITFQATKEGLNYSIDFKQGEKWSNQIRGELKRTQTPK